MIKIGQWIFRSFRYVNIVYFRSCGGRSRPAFYEIETVSPALSQLYKHADVIKQELEKVLLERSTIPRYHEVDQAQWRLSASDDAEANWRIFLLYYLGRKPGLNRTKCPRTSELLDSIPGLFQAFFSILEGGKSVAAHRSSYFGYLRYHLALRVPVTNPPSMRVKDRWVTWQEGAAFMFDDTWEHEVVNPSQEMRVVLIVDIFRPMGFLANALNHFVIFGLKHSFAKAVMARA
jgi:aspartyl/asparaginyl beta-hydroxylase (cupin superfamily)